MDVAIGERDCDHFTWLHSAHIWRTHGYSASPRIEVCFVVRRGQQFRINATGAQQPAQAPCRIAAHDLVLLPRVSTEIGLRL
jgi:hypothetical protein